MSRPPADLGQKTKTVSTSRLAGERCFSRRLVLQGTLLWGNNSLLVPFVDLHADDSFINENLAKQTNLPQVKLC